MSETTDRISELEREDAELRSMIRPERRRGGRWWRRPRRLVIVGVALALVLPAVVLAGGQSFSDVPPSNKFFADIEAVNAANVTHGCGGTRYCPDGLVTRGQMAAFMNRLGALGAGKTPVVNADKLDGLDSSDFSRAAYGSVRTDLCFFGPGNHCQLSDARNIDHVRRTSTGLFCVAPAAGTSFADRTPAFSFQSPTNLAVGVPIIIALNPGSCAAGEIQVQVWAWTEKLSYSTTDAFSFGIVIP